MTDFLFFSGKGGVGKTTMAATTAVYNAMRGKKTLIISTDPASNLGDIFETRIGHTIAPIIANLFAMDIDPDAATEEYREKVIGPMRGVMPDDIMKVLEEQFRSACTTEIAAFDRFTDFLVNEEFDLVVFDTAPTGHTIRLLELPVDWSKHIEESAKGSGQTCIGPVSSIQGAKEKYDRAIAAMRDGSRTTFYLVLKPEKTSLAETLRARDELNTLGIRNFRVIINGIYPDDKIVHSRYANLSALQARYLGMIEKALPYPSSRVTLQSGEIKGLPAITDFAGVVFEGKKAAVMEGFHQPGTFDQFADGEALTHIIQKKRDTRIVIITGKGGVGKTVTACAVAAHLAGNRQKTLLVTTDPAAHIGHVLDEPIGDTIGQTKSLPYLSAARIDQKKSVEIYKKKIIDDAVRSGYSDDMLIALKEELESPCTEEMAVFEEFASVVENRDFDYIVFDTAPTGHTLRLLELPYDYARQVELMVQIRKEGGASDRAQKKLKSLLGKLKDPAISAFMLVFYPEYTPIHEAKRTLDDLNLAGIGVQAVIANNVLENGDKNSEFFHRRAEMQQHYLETAKKLFQLPVFKIPMFDDEIIGLPRLKQVAESLFQKECCPESPLASERSRAF
ncbi:MAG: TRC40/GET3/ArsA family transport-energizing ATPase [Candidatus Aminicenantes bacterium]|nr:TRC40/GET3/ArsA family transport-energizing ATPase [Candidatus Aminicenantes bacterium]